MTAADFLQTLSERGVILWQDPSAPSGLALRAPRGMVTPAVAERIKAAAPRLIPLLPATREEAFRSLRVTAGEPQTPREPLSADDFVVILAEEEVYLYRDPEAPGGIAWRDEMGRVTAALAARIRREAALLLPLLPEPPQWTPEEEDDLRELAHGADVEAHMIEEAKKNHLPRCMPRLVLPCGGEVDDPNVAVRGALDLWRKANDCQHTASTAIMRQRWKQTAIEQAAFLDALGKWYAGLDDRAAQMIGEEASV